MVTVNEAVAVRPSVDVVVVGFRSASDVERAVESIRLSVGVDVTTIVVDNSNSPEIAEIAARTNSRLVVAEGNVGYGAACNLGLEASTAEWVAFSNQDVAVAPDTIASLVDAVSRHRRTGREAVAGPLLLSPSGSPSDGGHRLPTLGSQIAELLFGERLARSRRTAPHTGGTVTCGWLPAAFVLGRASVFRSVGGFDSRFFMYVEDVDLFSRLSSIDVDCLWVTSTDATHSGGRRPISAELYAGALHNWGEYFRDRHGVVAERVLLCAGIVGSLARWAVWSIRSIASSDRDGAAYARMFGRSAVKVLPRAVSTRRRVK